MEDKKIPIPKKKRGLVIALSILFIIVVINLLVGLIWGMDAVKGIWDFISNQILGMKWLNVSVGKLLSFISGDFALGTWQNTAIDALHFFIYDFIKIGILLCVLIFSVSYIQSYFPPERTKRILGKYKGIGANFIGALLGTVTPFCSCSSIPIFIGFTRAGLSSGITFSFLISSPLVDLGSLVLLVGFFGWNVAIIYVAVGLLLAVVGGTIIEKTGIGKYVEDFVISGSSTPEVELPELTVKDRLEYARDQMWQIYKKVFWYIVIGVGIGSIIHNVIPREWIEGLLGANKWYSVLLATVLGAPMYADIFGTLPIAEALFTKGAGLGTILAFMMSVTALSLPSMIMLGKAVKPKLLLAFISIVIVGIIIIGYLFNLYGELFI